MKQPVRVLLIEDNAGDARLIEEMIAEEGAFTFNLERVERLSSGLERLAKKGVEVVLLNLSLPDSRGLASLQKIIQNFPEMPIVVLTGLDDEVTAIEAVHEGAQDYLIKGKVNRSLLERSLRYAIERQNMLVALQRRTAELKRSRENFLNVIEDHPDGMAVINEERVVLFINSALKSIFGLKGNDLVGHPFPYPFTSGERKEVELPNGDQRRVARMQVIRTEWEEQKCYLVLLHDITTYKRSQEALLKALQTKKELEQILNKSPVVLFVWSLKERWPVDFVSDNISKFGYSPADFYSGSLQFSDIIHPEDLARLKEEVCRLREEGFHDYSLEYRLLAKQGGYRWIEGHIWLIGDEGGQEHRYQGIALDITERKQAEEELRLSLEKLRKAMDQTIQAMSFTVEIRDAYTASHQRRVAELATAIAEEMGLSKEQIEGIRLAAAIHDIGKISTPAEILNKAGRLTEIEFSIIKSHPQVGFEILKKIEFPWPIAKIVLQHHERLDGSGYPMGLRKDESMLEARILSVADVVEAMSSHRPYRPALGLEEALKEITQKKGILYDPGVVNSCLKLFQKGRLNL